MSIYLTAAVTEICALAGIRPAAVTSAFFGLPAYGEVAADVPVLDAAPRAVLQHDRYRCDNDMVCGWAGSLALADGINVISGTGSMTDGRSGAARIIEEAATELVRLVETTRSRLGITGAVPVSYSGGVLTAPEVLQAFTARLEGSYELREPQYSPVVGAALYAAALVGEPLGLPARETLRRSQETTRTR